MPRNSPIFPPTRILAMASGIRPRWTLPMTVATMRFFWRIYTFFSIFQFSTGQHSPRSIANSRTFEWLGPANNDLVADFDRAGSGGGRWEQGARNWASPINGELVERAQWASVAAQSGPLNRTQRHHRRKGLARRYNSFLLKNILIFISDRNATE